MSVHAFMVGEGTFIVRDSVFYLAFSQAGGGQAVPGGDGLRCTGTLQPFACGQRARQ